MIRDSSDIRVFVDFHLLPTYPTQSSPHQNTLLHPLYYVYKPINVRQFKQMAGEEHTTSDTWWMTSPGIEKRSADCSHFTTMEKKKHFIIFSVLLISCMIERTEWRFCWLGGMNFILRKLYFSCQNNIMTLYRVKPRFYNIESRNNTQS